MSYLIDDTTENAGHLSSLLSKIKNAVALEYIPVSDNCENGLLNVLILNGDKFEWINVEDAIPVTSDRAYPTRPTPVVAR